MTDSGLSRLSVFAFAYHIIYPADIGGILSPQQAGEVFISWYLAVYQMG